MKPHVTTSHPTRDHFQPPQHSRTWSVPRANENGLRPRRAHRRSSLQEADPLADAELYRHRSLRITTVQNGRLPVRVVERIQDSRLRSHAQSDVVL